MTKLIIGIVAIATFSLTYVFITPTQPTKTKTSTFGEPDYISYIVVSSLKLDDGALSKDESAKFKIDVKFGEDKTISYPESGAFELSNKKSKKMNYLLEVPKNLVKYDGFDFQIQIIVPT